MANQKQKRDLTPAEIDEIAASYAHLAKSFAEIAQTMKDKGLKEATFRSIKKAFDSIEEAKIALGYCQLALTIADIEKEFPVKKKR